MHPRDGSSRPEGSPSRGRKGGSAAPEGLGKCHGQVRSFVKSREFAAIDTEIVRFHVTSDSAEPRRV